VKKEEAETKSFYCHGQVK